MSEAHDREEFYETLKKYGKKIAEQADAGILRAQQVIDLYKVHYDAPGDPGAYGLVRAAFAEWVKGETDG